jgi:DNA repair protein RadA/Sms
VVLVGHVTKDGSVAGPKTLEHIVDVILSLEGERGGPLRILRALKNRFGSCEEAALFSMEATGLRAIEDPSAMLLSDRARGAPGSVVFPALEGTRPMLVEIQALVTKSSLAQPRRVAIGVDPRRLSMLIGVMTKHKALDDAAADVFVAAAGGFHVKDPASDLAIALTLSSSARGIPILEDTIAIGEIGLAGELRRVSGLDRRLAEAARLGFRTAIVPRGAPRSSESLRNVEVADLRSAIDAAFAGVVA